VGEISRYRGKNLAILLSGSASYSGYGGSASPYPKPRKACFRVPLLGYKTCNPVSYSLILYKFMYNKKKNDAKTIIIWYRITYAWVFLAGKKNRSCRLVNEQ
jgi:hypothetical protein